MLKLRFQFDTRSRLTFYGGYPELLQQVRYPPLPDHTHPLHQPHIIRPGYRYRGTQYLYMVFVDAVDMQDGDLKGAVNFDDELPGQGFQGIGQGGAYHEMRLSVMNMRG